MKSAGRVGVGGRQRGGRKSKGLPTLDEAAADVDDSDVQFLTPPRPSGPGRSEGGGGGSGSGDERSPAKRARRNEYDDEEGQQEGQPPRSSDPFSNLPPDALTIVLKYALPSDDIHRFEFAWSMGKISKSLQDHSTRILDMLPVSPFHLEEYEEYSPLNGRTSDDRGPFDFSDDREPFDCRAALIMALATDPTKCALISELHITRQSIEKPDGRIDNGMVKSLRSVLTKEGAFKNAQTLSINLNPVDLEEDDRHQYTNISLLNKAMMKKMPKSFPSITNVTLGHCFYPEIIGLGQSFPGFFPIAQDSPEKPFLVMHTWSH